MHDSSLPTGDRVDATGPMPTPASDGLPAFALMISGRGFVRAWRRGREPVMTRQISRARVFTVAKRAVTELAKLRRRGMQCSVVPVVLKIVR